MILSRGIFCEYHWTLQIFADVNENNAKSIAVLKVNKATCATVAPWGALSVAGHHCTESLLSVIKIGPWGPELIWYLATKHKMSRQQVAPAVYHHVNHDKWG